MILNEVIRMNMLPKNHILKLTVNNENKLCYESYLDEIGFDTMNC